MIRVVLAILLFSLFTQARPLVKIPSQVKVGAVQQLTLGDVAQIEKADDETIQSLKKIVLVDSWIRGQSLNISSLNIVEKIQAADLVEKPKFEIPKFVLVESSQELIEEDLVKKKIMDKFYSLCNDCVVQLTSLKIPKLVVENDVDFKWNLDVSNLTLARSFSLPINVHYVDTHKNYWVSGDIKLIKKMPTATRNLSMGQRVQPDDIIYKEIDVISKMDWINADAEVIGQVLDRPVSIGLPIYKSDLKREPAIQRGQIIKVITGTEQMEISSQAQSEAAGFVGDIIKLKSMDGVKLMSGRVVEKGVVRIE